MTAILSATLLRTQSDARLTALTREGHEPAFEAIVERYRRTLHRSLRRMLPESRSEDALQQTFIKAWSALGDGGAEVKDLKPWLYRIAHNTALDALKKSGYDYDELQQSLRSPNAPDADFERRTVMRETLAGVAALPDRQREALLRIAVEGQSRAQVAHDLGLNDGAVRQLVHRARMTLRAAATAVTPLPLAAWAAAREHNGPVAQRGAELAAGGGAAGGAGLLLKGGAVIAAAGALAVGPSALKPGDRPASAATKVAGAAPIAGRTPGYPESTGAEAASEKGLEDRRSRASSRGRGRTSARPGSEGSGRGGGDRSTGGDHGASGDEHRGSESGSSGPGPSGDDHSNSGPGGGEDLSGSGSSPSGGDPTRGATSGEGTSGSGMSGSGSSGSGSSSSGSGLSSGDLLDGH